MAELTDFRENVRATIAAALGITIVPGYLEGPFDDGDFGCIYPESQTEMGEAVDVEINVVRVRLFKQYLRSTNPKSPIDPEPLERMAEDAKAALTVVQTTAGPWFFRVTETLYDAAANVCELVVRGWAANTFG